MVRAARLLGDWRTHSAPHRRCSSRSRTATGRSSSPSTWVTRTRTGCCASTWTTSSRRGRLRDNRRAAYYGMREIELTDPTATGSGSAHRGRVTVRRSAYRSIRSLQRDNARCRACLEAGFQIESWPSAALARAARVALRPGRPGSSRARSGCPGAAAPARRCGAGPARRRRALRTLLLRFGHALLSGPTRVRAAATAHRARASRICASSGGTGSSSCCGRS